MWARHWLLLRTSCQQEGLACKSTANCKCNGALSAYDVVNARPKHTSRNNGSVCSWTSVNVVESLKVTIFQGRRLGDTCFSF
jgi:hypothetical protein